jgi:hypothetical protein
MVGARWTTDEQFAWLTERLPSFIDNQTNGSQEKWLKATYEAFFDSWSTRAALEEELFSEEGGEVRELTPDELNMIGARIKSRKNVGFILTGKQTIWLTFHISKSNLGSGGIARLTIVVIKANLPKPTHRPSRIQKRLVYLLEDFSQSKHTRRCTTRRK